MKKRTIAIKVVNREVGYSYWWDVETLSNRYYIIKDMSEQYFETGTIPILDQNNDPFWDPQVSTTTATMRIPHMAALAGLVPWADTGMRQTSRSPSPCAAW